MLNKKQCQVFKLSYTCDECGVGEVTPTGLATMQNPPKYQHTCPNCGAAVMLDTQYPTLMFEEISTNE